MRHVAQRESAWCQSRHMRRNAMEGPVALTDAELAAVAGGDSLSIFIFNNSFNNISDSMLIFGSELVNSLNTNSFNSGSFNTGNYIKALLASFGLLRSPVGI